MKAPRNEFPISELNTVGNVVPLFMTGSAFIIGLLDFVTDGKVVGSNFISSFLLSVLPVFVLIRLTSKIRFNEDYVEKMTIFGRRRIKFDSVKSFGVWVIYGRFIRFLPQVVEAEKLDEYALDRLVIARYVIFISTLESIDPLHIKKKETITFQFRKDVYGYVESVLSEYCQQSKPGK
jgi:hypothetical protein